MGMHHSIRRVVQPFDCTHYHVFSPYASFTNICQLPALYFLFPPATLNLCWAFKRRFLFSPAARVESIQLSFKHPAFICWILPRRIGLGISSRSWTRSGWGRRSSIYLGSAQKSSSQRQSSSCLQELLKNMDKTPLSFIPARWVSSNNLHSTRKVHETGPRPWPILVTSYVLYPFSFSPPCNLVQVYVVKSSSRLASIWTLDVWRAYYPGGGACPTWWTAFPCTFLNYQRRHLRPFPSILVGSDWF